MNNPTERQIIEVLRKALNPNWPAVKQATEAIKSLFRKGEVWKPEEGERVIAIFGDGQLTEIIYSEFPHKRFVNLLGIFPNTTEGRKQAERKLAMVKAVFPSGERFRPELGKTYWRWFNDSAEWFHWSNRIIDKFNFNIGNVHQTKEGAEAYGELMSKE